MIHSIFVITPAGDVIIEKHYKAPVSRTVLDPFFEEQVKAGSPEAVAPCINSTRHYIISVLRNGLFFVAVVNTDVQPLFVVEFLHRMVDTFNDYFAGTVTEKKLLNETVVVYQVLEEMLDNGFPLTTEANQLKDMVRPPSWMDPVTGKKRVKDTLPTGQLSATQWRRAGVRYTTNEFFLDIEEKIEAIIDRNGTTISVDVYGEMNCRSKLSGMPELVLSFVNPRLIDDVSFHPCVRLAQWANERCMAFVPPDGAFNLCKYSIVPAQISLPLFVRPSFTFDKTGGRFELEVGPKVNVGKPVEEVSVIIPFPASVNDVKLTFTSNGLWKYDQLTRVLRWDLKKMPLDRGSTLRGTIGFALGESTDESPVIMLEFKIPSYAASGLKVNRLDIHNEKYKPFKGVKYSTTAKDFQVRT
eukprot:m.143598 g.143598  ORF g.143598 m.143598 type:complete len:413 (-) comp16742_c5_seq2:365-1603(-)